MLIPLRHENMEGRRWPVITFGLIALNVLIFLGTHSKIEAQEPERAEVRTHVLILAATHPELKTSDEIAKFIDGVKSKLPEQEQSPARGCLGRRTATRRRSGAATVGNGFAGAALRRNRKNLHS